MLEATPAEQERMWWSGLEAMARVHRADWRRLGLHWLDRPGRGRPGLDQQLSYYREFLDWSAKGRPQPVAEAAWDWLVANRPDEDGRGGAVLGRQPAGQHHLAGLPSGGGPRLGDGHAGPARARPRAGGSTSTASSAKASPSPGRPASPPTTRPWPATASSSGAPCGTSSTTRCSRGSASPSSCAGWPTCMIESGQLAGRHRHGHEQPGHPVHGPAARPGPTRRLSPAQVTSGELGSAGPRIPCWRSRSTSQATLSVAPIASSQPSTASSRASRSADRADHRHGHALHLGRVHAVGPGHVDAAEGVQRLVGVGLAHDVELAGVLHPVQLVTDPVLVVPVATQLQLGRAAAALVGVVELLDVHRRTVVGAGVGPRSNPWRPGRRQIAARCGPGGRSGGRPGVRCSGDARQLHAPDRPDDRRMAGAEPYPPSHAKPWPGWPRPSRRWPSLGVADLGELVEYLRGCETEAERRTRAAGVVQAMLRSQAVHPLVARAVLQAILPGLVAVARRLRWGSGGDWDGRRVVPGRCRGHRLGGDRRVVRPRPRLRRPRPALGHPLPAPSPDGPPARRARRARHSGSTSTSCPAARSVGTTGPDELARALEQMGDPPRPSATPRVLYANRVLGLTVTELARMSGRSRRTVAGRRDRAVEELLHACA